MLKRIINRWLEKTFPENPCGTDNKQNREDWLKKTISEIPSGHRILDAGAGELQYKPLCEHLNYIAQDFGKYDGRGDGVALQTQTWDQTQLDIICDICDIPEPDGSFDAILCVEVFEHLSKPRGAVREFSRLLKPGGVLILTAPFCSLTHFAPYHFYTGFNKFFYEDVLPELGFEIENIDANGNYFAYMAQEVQRLPAVIHEYLPSTPKVSRLKQFMQRWAQRILLDRLQQAESADTASSELLCYGYHIRARKL